MPRSRKYATNAERQAAYRQRCSGNTLSLRGGPVPLPPVAAAPGRRRWRSMIAGADALVQRAADEMQEYYEQRPERWQDSEQGEQFLELTESIQAVLSAIEDIQWQG